MNEDFSHKMQLTPEQIDLLTGKKGETMARVMKTLVMYGEAFGATTASNGAVGLYHIEHLTPEAAEAGESILAENPKVYVIDDAELERVKASYPVIWKNPDAKPKLCFVGCPHLSFAQLGELTEKLTSLLAANGRKIGQEFLDYVKDGMKITVQTDGTVLVEE